VMWGYGFGWVGWLIMLAVWVLFVVGMVWLVRTLATPSGGGSDQNSRRILDERFARGELSVEEYEDRRRVLR
jgi:putative membrane protein